MVKYILILALLIVIGTIGLWIFLEHKYKEEELVERVEPDLQDMFEEIASKRQQKTTSLPEEQLPAHSREELSLAPEMPVPTEKKTEEPVASHDMLSHDHSYDVSDNYHNNEAALTASFEGYGTDDYAQASSIENTSIEDSVKDNNNQTAPSSLAERDRTVKVNQGISNPLKEGLTMLERVKDFFKRKREIYNPHGSLNSLEALMRPPAVKTIAFLLRAPEEQPYTIREILEVAAEQQLHIGEEGFLDYLTATHYGDEPMYSVAHMLSPGTFRENGHVIQDLEMEVPGILLFSQIPGPDPEVSTIDHLIRAAAQFGNALGGTLYDESEQAVDKTSLEKIRQDIDILDKHEWDRVLS